MSHFKIGPEQDKRPHPPGIQALSKIVRILDPGERLAAYDKWLRDYVAEPMVLTDVDGVKTPEDEQAAACGIAHKLVAGLKEIGALRHTEDPSRVFDSSKIRPGDFGTSVVVLLERPRSSGAGERTPESNMPPATA